MAGKTLRISSVEPAVPVGAEAVKDHDSAAESHEWDNEDTEETEKGENAEERGDKEVKGGKCDE